MIGKTLTIDDLFEQGFEAVFIGSGAGLPNFMHIPGESLKGVYSANEYLTRINLMKAYDEKSRTPIQRSKAVAVVGGGNVAMDCRPLRTPPWRRNRVHRLSPQPRRAYPHGWRK